MAMPEETIPQSSSEIPDPTDQIKGNEKEVEDSLQQKLDHQSDSFVQLTGDSNSNDDFEGSVDGQLETDDLASETRKLAPVATSAKVTEESSAENASIEMGGSVEGIKKVQIDTKAPIESVKAAVSKFGGIVDWRAHKVNTSEKSKGIEQELEKVQEELPLYKEQAEIAEQSKNQMLKELEGIKTLIEDLKQNLERVQTEERQAKEDSLLVQQRVEELEQEISREASAAAKTEVEVAKARHVVAVTDLRAVEDELEELQKEYANLLKKKEFAEKKVEEAISTSKEMEKKVEVLKSELITVKESLEVEQATILENEKKRKALIVVKEEDIMIWDKDLKQAEADLEKLNKEVESAKDMKSKVDTASSLVMELKAELVTYMDAKVNQEKDSDKSDTGMLVAVAKELEELKLSIEKLTDEVNSLKVESVSLKAKLEHEQSELANLKQRETMTSATTSSLEGELARITSEIAALQTQEKEASGKLAELPMKLQRATQEADEAKLDAALAHEELNKAEKEAKQAKAEVDDLESRLLAAQKEIKVVQATQKSTFDATTTLKTSEPNQTKNDEVALSLEEYYELTRLAHDAEEQAHTEISAALSKLDAAKASNSRSLKQLEEVNREVEERKETLRVALENAGKAKETKLAVEQELRKWRAEHELMRKASELPQVSLGKNKEGGVQGLKGVDPSIGEGLKIEKVVETSSPLIAYGQGPGLKQLAGTAPKPDEISPKADGPSPTTDGISPNADGQSPKGDGISPRGTLGQSNTIKKKKKSFFPRFFMFFTRRRSKQS